MKRVRQALFWAHLACGLVAGIAIAIMCFTGVALAFEDELTAWAERDARRVEVPNDTARLSLAALEASVRQAHSELRSPTITVQRDPGAAVAFSAGRDGGYFVNPYTGEIREPASTTMRDFMRVMTDWHRFLGRAGDGRPVGKLINGVCNLAFGALAVTGLYLWWPRKLTWRSVKAVALFNWRLAGRARDFNWHNTIGLWCAPILIVLTLTAVPMSFRWGNDLVYRMVGEEPAVRGGPPGAGGTKVDVGRPTADAVPLDADAVMALVEVEFPTWEQATIRRGGAARGPRQADGRETLRKGGPSPITVTIREPASRPRTASTTLTIHPYTGQVLQRDGFGDLSTGRRIRTWTRFLHTGQALGWSGQLVAGLACLGGLFLVYTGFALAWRRFFGRQPRAPAGSSAAL